MFILYVGCVSYIYIYTYNSCILFLKDHENITEKTHKRCRCRTVESRCITERLREQRSALDWERGLGGSSWSNGWDPPGKKALNKGYTYLKFNSKFAPKNWWLEGRRLPFLVGNHFEGRAVRLPGGINDHNMKGDSSYTMGINQFSGKLCTYN